VRNFRTLGSGLRSQSDRDPSGGDGIWGHSLTARTKVHHGLDTIFVTLNDPPMSLASIQNEIEKLEPSERAALIDVLWESLDHDRIKEIEAKWTAESEDRIDAFERGELPAVDGPTAIEELRSSLTK